MKKYAADEIRNIAVIGHGGEGKTTLCEVMLYNGKATDRIGKITDGNTVMDFDEAEIAKKMSISLSAAYFEWQGAKINLLDVPGFYDFEGELRQGFAAADGAVLVAGANGVCTVGAEKAIKYSLKTKMPMVIFVNGIDKENSDYLKTVEAFKDKFPAKLAPIQIPIIEGGKMKGYINALKEKAYLFADGGPVETEIPADMQAEYESLKSQLTETAAENDDELLEKFFEDGTLSKEDTVKGIRIGLANGNTIPVMAGSALLNKGVFNLMDEIVNYMPKAKERFYPAKDGEGNEIVLDCDADKPFAALVFKTTVDAFVGKLNMLKVVRGRLKSGVTVINSATGKEERISQIYILKGKKQESVDELSAGDIGAVSKLSATNTGDTLCDASFKVEFDRIDFPQPVISMAVYAEKSGEEDKIFAGLNKISEEDRSFRVDKEVETGEILIHGQGEMQLEIICRKLKNKFGTGAILKTPKIAFREMIKKVIETEGKHKKQSGGHGQYGHCKIRFEPTDGDFIFDEEVVGGSVPKNYIPAVEKGVRECLKNGIIAGYPVVGLKAVLYDGSYHDVDSSEIAFKLAAALCFRQLTQANPVLLEPVMSVRIKVPEAYMGDILGDLNKRRGKVLGMDLLDDSQVINAEVPKAELLRYATELRSMTQGRGKFSAEFLRYEEMPFTIAEKIIEERKKAEK